MNENRHTADSITDDALDELYEERDRVRQLAERWENALAPDLAYARALRAALDGSSGRPCALPQFMACDCDHVNGCQHPTSIEQPTPA